MQKLRDGYFRTDLGEIVREKDHDHPNDGIHACDTCGFYMDPEDAADQKRAMMAMG